ncbi:MAG: chromosome segregation protein SMC [Mariprofundus sp.]
MRLKRIELAGFKSFVDPTRIELGDGITAIVGPNGCGKSNIIDALRWVLGEHSARHLRGAVMDDLIFQGSETRPPVSVCDVELTFAVAHGALPPPYHELEEISVRRRLQREGVSDAFINGKMVRLKDIIDLFLDSGISTRAYAIVEQGSIARMVTARPEERRVLFEEAAGVMKYRSRRREAERRMQDTRQNLDRVLDLLEEVRRQCRSLKQQAARAGRFRALQDQSIQLESQALGLRYAALQQGCVEQEQQRDIARLDAEAAAASLSACEHASVTAHAQVQVFEEQAQQIQEQLHQAEQQRASLQQQAERMAGERRLLRERQHALEARINEGSEHIQRIRDEDAQLQATLDAQHDDLLHTQRAGAARAVDGALQHYRQQSSARDQLLAAYERLKRDAEQAAEQQCQAEAATLHLEQRHAQLHEQIAQAQQQRLTMVQKLTACEQWLHTALQRQQDDEQQLQQATAALDHGSRACQQAGQVLAEAEAILRERTGLVQELTARARNQDVDEMLRARLQSQGVLWMDELLHVPEGLDLAVAAALRGRSADALMPPGCSDEQLSVVIGHAATAPLALFIAAPEPLPTQAAASPVESQSLADALDLAVDDPMRVVFSPVFLVEQIEQAIGYGVLCVSRDGWRYEPGGWLIPPAGNRSARRMAVKRELIARQRLQLAAEAELVPVRAGFTRLDAELETLQQDLQQARLQKTAGDSDAQAATAALALAQSELIGVDERLQRLAVDLDDVGKQQQHWRQQLASLKHSDAGQLEQAGVALAGRDAAMQAAEHGLNRARASLASAEQALALFIQAGDHLRHQQQRLQADRDRWLGQRQADAEQLSQLALNVLKADEHRDLDDQISAASALVEQAHVVMNHARQQGYERQQRVHEAEKAERQARELRQQGALLCQRIELALAQDEARLQALEREIQQRCHQPAATLLANLDTTADVEVDDITARSREISERLNRFGAVNLLAISEFEQASEREGFLGGQAADLEASLTTLSDTIARIDRTTRQRFRNVFEQTNAIFKQTFPQLFGGGRAELRLDSDNILTAGVEVIAQPPGKCLQDIGLLSGGEKALTAVALVFAIFRVKPAPFCVLDEVDAPLDDANVGRFGDMVRELSSQVQFMSITHNKITMQKADRLVGVSMPEAGVSRIIAVAMEGAGV